MNLSQTNPWLLPEGIEEVLPKKAAQLESYRRELVDFYMSWGYELVMPPFIEYYDSLLIGAGKDLELQTFTVTDQLSGKLLGIRADMTPQVARMDAHHLKDQEINRLCYLGTVLRTRPERLGGTRAPLQIGAEIYGHDGIESDAEIIELMIASVSMMGLDNLTLDLGNTNIFSGLIAELDLHSNDKAQLLDAVIRKSTPDLVEMLANWQVPENIVSNLLLLVSKSGDAEAIQSLKAELVAPSKSVVAELQRTDRLVELLGVAIPQCKLHVDFAELHGYQYQTGTVFSVYADEVGQELARGGRYNNIGSAFGEGRPATGFSADLKFLTDVSRSNAATASAKKVVAPWTRQTAAMAKIKSLRAEGYLVTQTLPNTSPPVDAEFELVETKTGWDLRAR